MELPTDEVFAEIAESVRFFSLAAFTRALERVLVAFLDGDGDGNLVSLFFLEDELSVVVVVDWLEMLCSFLDLVVGSSSPTSI